jgi:hypothetical protein
MNPIDEQEQFRDVGESGLAAIRCLDCAETHTLRWRTEQRLRDLVAIHGNCIECGSKNIVNV